MATCYRNLGRHGYFHDKPYRVCVSSKRAISIESRLNNRPLPNNLRAGAVGFDVHSEISGDFFGHGQQITVELEQVIL
ncbi:MAG: hypothetical protein ACREN8_13920, partial [Candidatus Dormibacteraceae bacterium]